MYVKIPRGQFRQNVIVHPKFHNSNDMMFRILSVRWPGDVKIGCMARAPRFSGA
jgi:hypothetical protein